MTADATGTPTTPEGQELVELLHRNARTAVARRRRIAHILTEFVTTPDSPARRENDSRTFGDPGGLPDSAAKRPPGGNRLTTGVAVCRHALRAAGALPEAY